MASHMMWQCPCGFKNKLMNQICGGTGPMGCKLPKPDPETLGAILQTSYGPLRLKNKKDDDKPRYPRNLWLSQVAHNTPWVCMSCGHTNDANNQVCGGESGAEGCGKSASDVASYAPFMAQAREITEKFDDEPEDPNLPSPWCCVQCGFRNKPFNTICGGGGPMGCKVAREKGDRHYKEKMEEERKYSEEQAQQAAAIAAIQMQVLQFQQTQSITQQFRKTWLCGCSFLNAGDNLQCGGDDPTLGCKGEPPNDWLCRCGFVNKPKNTLCGGSGTMGCKSHRRDAKLA